MIEENQAGTTAAALEEYERPHQSSDCLTVNIGGKASFFIISVPAQKNNNKTKKYDFTDNLTATDHQVVGVLCMQMGSIVKMSTLSN